MNKKDAQKIIKKISNIQQALFEIEGKLFDEFFLEDEIKKIKMLYDQNVGKDFNIADVTSKIYNLDQVDGFDIDFEEKESKIRIAFGHLLDDGYLDQVIRKDGNGNEVITYKIRS